MSHAIDSASTAGKPRFLDAGKSRAILLLLAIIVAAGALLRIYFFSPSIQRSPDEFTFTRQANLLLSLGRNGMRLLAAQLQANPAVFGIQPSPGRIGYIGVLAAFMQISRDHSILAGAHLSLFCSIATLALLAIFAYRRLSAAIAILATLFYAVLPFDLVIARRAWQESFIALLALLVLIVCVGIASSQPRWRYAQLAAFCILGIAGITTKANLAGVYALCAGGLVLYFLYRRESKAALLVTIFASAAAALSIFLWIYTFGSLGQYLQIVRTVNHYAFSGTYELQYNTGPAWMFLWGFLRTCPVLILAAFTGIVSIAWRVLQNPRSALGLRCAVALLACSLPFAQLVTNHKDYRYTAPAFAFLCLLAAIGLVELASLFRRVFAPASSTLSVGILVAAVAITTVRDLNFARENFLDTQMPDLSLRMVLGLPPLPISAAPNVATIDDSDNSIQSRINLSLRLIQQNQPGRAIAVLDSVLAKDPNNAIAWNNHCAANNMLMYYKEAATDCTQALRASPDFQLAHNNLRWAQDQLAAIQRQLEAQENVPATARDRDYYMAQGMNFLHIGDYDRAISAWQHALALDSADASAANNIGTAYMFKHQPQDAIHWFHKALDIDPTLQLARNNLAWAQSVASSVAPQKR